MNSGRYWRERALEREQHWNDVATKKLEREIKFYYQQSLEKIRRDIESLYARYANQNGLSMAEARRLIRGDEFTVWRMTLEEYVKAAKNDSDILKELNTLAMRSRISRFEALHARTMIEIAELCERLEKFEDALQYRAYVQNYYGNLYDIHKEYGLSTPPVAVDKNQAEKVLRTAWSGANYSQRIWKNGRKLERAIKSTMLEAIHRGTSIQKLSKDLSQRMEVSYNNAERLIRTELNYIQTKAAADSIGAAEMLFYQFIAVMDNRTTPMCQSLDGEIFPLAELNQGENAPPMHVRCRSTICASIDDGKQGRRPTGQRAARDEEGKRIKVPADMKYPDWKAIYIDKTKTLEEWRAAKDAEYAAQSKNISPSLKANEERKSVKELGALGSVFNNKNDPTYEKRDKVAVAFYEQARQDKDNFVRNIAQNGNISVKSAEKIFEHIFVKKHNLNDKFRRFDPDYDMAESFRRIFEGEDIQFHDLILLKHERLEIGLIERYGYDYNKAHRITERKYNYSEALKKWLKERGDW